VTPLSQIEDFPEEYHPAIRAIIVALETASDNPAEYSAQIALSAAGVLEVLLRHASHRDDGKSWRGDPCHRCLQVQCDPGTGAVLRLHHIR
jgi:hypothetical protein